MEFTTRAAARADANRIAQFHVDSWKETYAHLLPEDFFSEEHAQQRREKWDATLRAGDPHVAIRVAERGDRLAGFIWCTRSPNAQNDELSALYVANAYHGTGIAQRLLDETLPAGHVELWVAEANPRAIRFYQRNGFVADGARREPSSYPLLVSIRMVRGGILAPPSARLDQ